MAGEQFNSPPNEPLLPLSCQSTFPPSVTDTPVSPVQCPYWIHLQHRYLFENIDIDLESRHLPLRTVASLTSVNNVFFLWQVLRHLTSRHYGDTSDICTVGTSACSLTRWQNVCVPVQVCKSNNYNGNTRID